MLYSTTIMYQFFGYQRRLNLVSLDTKHIHELESCRLNMSCSIKLANEELAKSCEVIMGHRYVPINRPVASVLFNTGVGIGFIPIKLKVCLAESSKQDILPFNRIDQW